MKERAVLSLRAGSGSGGGRVESTGTRCLIVKETGESQLEFEEISEVVRERLKLDALL